MDIHTLSRYDVKNLVTFQNTNVSKLHKKSAMDINRMKFQYAKAIGKFIFKEFSISIIEFKGQGSIELQLSDSLVIISTIKGGDLESRLRTDVLRERSVLHIATNSLPVTKLIIQFNESHNRNIQLSQQEASFKLLRVYCNLFLNQSHKQSSIEQMILSLLEPSGETTIREWVTRLKETLDLRWDEFPTLMDLSSELGVHPVTISKYFGRNSGMTISEYMRKIKVIRAVDMLLNTPESFASIAFICGFSDQSHMNRLVKKYIGYPPGVIRSLA